MKRRTLFLHVIVFILLLVLIPISGQAYGRSLPAPISTAFTYQGKLIDGGIPANGTYDLTFALYDALSGGVQIGGTLTRDDVTVSDGLFTVQLDFGAVFDGTAFYLEIGVRPGSGGAYVTLTPRQALTAAPYARYAAQAPWSGLTGVPAGFADGTDDGSSYTAGTGLFLNTAEFSILDSYRLPQTCANGQVTQWNGSTWVCADQSAYTAGTGLGISGGQFGLLGSYQLPQTCANGQFPQWNGSTWACADQSAYTAGTGLGVSGGQFGLLGSYQLPQTCANGQFPQWNGSTWACADQSAYTAGTGLGISGGQFGLLGSYQLPQTCANGQLPQWNGSTWACANQTAYTAGTGLALSGGQFRLFGPYQLPQGCANGQISQWNGSAWVCANDSGAAYAAGTGIDITGNVVSATYAGSSGDYGTASTLARSDHSHSNYLATGSAAGGDLTGTYPNPVIAVNAVGSAEIADGSVDMADTVNWMGFNAGSANFASGSGNPNIYIWGTAFTPSANGTCMVIANAFISSTGNANDDPQPFLSMVVDRGGAVSSDSYTDMPFTPQDVTTTGRSSASSTYVWTVNGGQSTQFGCRVTDPDGDWDTDETVRCRISYICQ